MVASISDLYGCSRRKGLLFGIEVEVEFPSGTREVHLDDNLRSDWRIVADGSLRNIGLEFISVPLPFPKARRSVHELLDYIDQFDPINTNRTSIHVHMNVSDLTQDQVLNTIILYSLLEDYFESFCGDSRSGNLFCLGTSYQDHYLTAIQENLVASNANSEARWFHSRTLSKYSALNILSLRNGTLEFRSLPNNHNISEVSNWLSALAVLRNVACKYKNVVKVLEDFDENFKMFQANTLGIVKHLGEKEIDRSRCMKNFSNIYLTIDTYKEASNPKPIGKGRVKKKSKYLFRNELAMDDIQFDELDDFELEE